jgi:hypothetical protein
VRACARPSCPQRGRWRRRRSPRAARPGRRRCAVWSGTCGPERPSSGARNRWLVRWPECWRSWRWRCFSGVRRGPQDLADCAAAHLPGAVAGAALSLPSGHGARAMSGAHAPFERVLAAADAAAVERALRLWQEQVPGPAQDALGIVDGKDLRHAKVERVSAVNGKGRGLGTVAVPEGGRRNPRRAHAAGQGERDRQTGAGRGPAHADGGRATNPLRLGGGDYLLTVKGNQKGRGETLEGLLSQQSFPPSARRRRPARSRGNATAGGARFACWTAGR